MNEPKNPPAFPVHSCGDPIADGMTLRDYFAAKAMQGLLGQQVVSDDNPHVYEPAYRSDWISPHAESDFEQLVLDAYAIADAMLAQREKDQ